MSKSPEINAKLIPNGMTPARYRELLKEMKSPNALYNEDIKKIEQHWKSYAEKKDWGPKESTVSSKAKEVKQTKKPLSTQNVSKESILKSVETQSSSSQIRIASKQINELTEKLATEPTPLQSKIISQGPKIMKGAALFIGTTSLLSTAMKVKDKAEEKAQTRSMEKRIKEDAKKEAEKKDRYQNDNSFRKVDTSDIVMDLFNERIGHHKMGNSRF